MTTSNVQIAQLADDLLQAALAREPIAASLFGLPGFDDKLPDFSEAEDARLRTTLSELITRADEIDPQNLSETDRVTRLVVQRVAAGGLDQIAARAVEYTITDSFIAPAIAQLSFLPMLRISSSDQADGYLARLRGLPAMFDTVVERHRAGIAAGRVPVRRLVEATVAHLDRLLAAPETDPLRQPMPAEDASVDTAAFVAERDRLLSEVVHPALRRYREVLADEVVSHGRPEERPGLCWLPEGANCYAGLVRMHTTTDRSPEELHRTGLEILQQLAEEYAQIGARVFGTSEVAKIRHRLRTDPAMRWRDGEELITAAREAISRAERAAPDWFGTLPQQQCTVAPVPEQEAPGAPGAYYMPPALDGSRPGVYFANTYLAEERDRSIAEAVAFHEGVPGHHFQLTRAQELTGLPTVRKLSLFTAYSEGWGLYAERLADEMGLYSDDLARLGMLSEDAVRAARLVVDTGLHAKGWSRQQVVDFLREHTNLTDVEINTETDRYISEPGQALAYMTGRLEIQRIRTEAEQALGARFDIQAFHDTVLGHGALPLDVLAEVVGDWVSRQRPAGA